MAWHGTARHGAGTGAARDLASAPHHVPAMHYSLLCLAWRCLKDCQVRKVTRFVWCLPGPVYVLCMDVCASEQEDREDPLASSLWCSHPYPFCECLFFKVFTVLAAVPFPDAWTHVEISWCFAGGVQARVTEGWVLARASHQGRTIGQFMSLLASAWRRGTDPGSGGVAFCARGQEQDKGGVEEVKIHLLEDRTESKKPMCQPRQPRFLLHLAGCGCGCEAFLCVSLICACASLAV